MSIISLIVKEYLHIYSRYIYPIAAAILGSYLITKTFGAALNTYINEWTIESKIEYNAIKDVSDLSRLLVVVAFILALLSSIVQSLVMRKEMTEKLKLDEEFGYKPASEA